MSQWMKFRADSKGSAKDLGPDVVTVIAAPMRSVIPALGQMPEAEVADALVSLVRTGFLDLQLKLWNSELHVRFRLTIDGKPQTGWQHIVAPLGKMN